MRLTTNGSDSGRKVKNLNILNDRRMNLNSFNVSNLCIINHNLLLRSIQIWLLFFFPALCRTALIRTECFS